jgi:hypothetical protein
MTFEGRRHPRAFHRRRDAEAPLTRQLLAVTPPRLEELDDVARRILHEDLASTRSADDLVAEVHARALEASNLGVEVGGDEVDAVPSARARDGAVWHRATGRAHRPAQQDAKAALRDVRERGRADPDLEPEVGGVEVHRLGHVVDHVPHVDDLIG